ncbi:MAG: adenylosuccinate synthetase, partial [Cytophagales bacterium]|nr:adenylosuccinate synthetase [Cytophagales bacterium]
FSHYGAGTFCGLPTYLSKHYIINTIMFNQEYNELVKKGVTPEVYIDESCLFTIPSDMMINQIVEKQRGKYRHGSCGLGINETIERNLRNTMLVRHIQYDRRDDIERFIAYVNKDYVIARLKRLGVKSINLDDLENMFSYEIIRRYALDFQLMLSRATVVKNSEFLKKYNDIIFEGGQGLLLDMNKLEYFPHLTRSKTGLTNVVDILNDAGLQDEKVDVNYITRCYLTRHGAGYLPRELDHKPYEKVLDLTNTPNEFQGKLRFAYLDLDLIEKTINKDFGCRNNFKKNIAITCLDQADTIKIYKSNTPLLLSEKELIQWFKDMGFDNIYTSHGMTRNDVKLV